MESGGDVGEGRDEGCGAVGVVKDRRGGAGTGGMWRTIFRGGAILSQCDLIWRRRGHTKEIRRYVLDRCLISSIE